MKNFKNIFFILLIFLMPLSLNAKQRHAELVSVDKLIKKTRDYLVENPNSKEALYTLASIHYLAFKNKSEFVEVYSEGISPRELPVIAPYLLLGNYLDIARSYHASELALQDLGVSTINWQDNEQSAKYYASYQVKIKEINDQNWLPKIISKEDILIHAKEAFLNFNKVIQIDSENSLYLLGLSNFFTKYLEYKKLNEIKNEPTEFKEITLEKAQVIYFKAYSLSFEKDSMLKSRPFTLCSIEAGRGYIEISKTKKDISVEEAKIVEKISENIEQLLKIPQFENY